MIPSAATSFKDINTTINATVTNDPSTASTSNPFNPIAIATKSFAAAIGNTRSTSIPHKSPSIHRGEPALFFSDEDIAALSSPFKFALIGKFSHGRPSLAVIKSTFETFGLKAAFSIGLIDPKHVLIKFNHEDDYHKVWLREQWYLQKFSMCVFK